MGILSRRKTLLLGVGLWVSRLCGSVDGGETGFQGSLRLGGLRSPVAATTGDFDGDGRQDLAALEDGQLAVFLNTGPDPSRFRGPLPGATVRGFHLRAADLDGDGNDDLAVADPSSSVKVLLSGGGGSFGSPVNLVKAALARWSAFGDFDRDGSLDVVTANWGARTVCHYRGSSDGTFDWVENYLPGEQPHAVEVGDYDGDGRLDLLVGLGSTSGLLPMRWLTAETGGRFEMKPIVPTLGCIRYLAVADLNSDGLADVAASCDMNGSIFAGLSSGDGSFRQALSGAPGRFVAIADLNSDGNLDLAVTEVLNPLLQVYPGKGDGTFLPRIRFFGLGRDTSFLCSGELDGDGAEDLIASDISLSALTVFFGSRETFLAKGIDLSPVGPTKALTVADLDLDGSPDLAVPRSTRPEVEVYRNAGGRFDRVAALTLSAPATYSSLEGADLDGDEIPDLVGVSLAPPAASVMLLRTEGGVRESRSFPTCALPGPIAVGFLDAGGRLDLVIPCAAAGLLQIFLNPGVVIESEPQKLATIHEPRKAVIADVDTDGVADVIVISRTGLAVHFREAAGLQSALVTVFEAGTVHLTAVGVLDVEGDSRPDLLAAESQGKNVLLFRGIGGRRFGEMRSVPWTFGPLSLIPVDLDGDQQSDVTTANSGESITAAFNRGGELGTPSAYTLSLAPLGHQVADLDLDGSLDLVGFSTTGVSVVLAEKASQESPRFRRGDVDGDGSMEINDPIGVLSLLFQGTGPLACEDAADGNDDGRVDVSDAVVMLNRLFLGGDPLPPPGPQGCGEDPSGDALAPCGGGC